MKRLMEFMKGHRLECILGPLFKLCEATLELFVPLIIARIIDDYIPLGEAGRSGIISQSLILLLLGFVGLMFSVTAQFFCARAAVGSVTKMRYSLFSHLGTLSYTEIDKLGTSTMITRMTSDANQVQTGINLTLRLLLRSPFVVFGAMVMAWVVAPDTAWLFGVTIAALSVIVFGIMLITMPLYKKVQGGIDGVVEKTRDNLSGARVIRAFSCEDGEISDFEARNNALAKGQRLAGRISALMNPLTYVIINLAILFLIYTGAIDVSVGNLTAGQVVALYNYMSSILIELVKMANFIISMTKSAACLGRIGAVLDIKSSMTEGEHSEGIDTDVAVEFRGASLTYSGASQSSVEGVTLTAKRGEVIGIIGGTGSGKSSLINLIPRLYDATEGEVLINGRSIKDYRYDALRSKIGIVPQRATLFAGTIRDNMRYANCDATDDEIMRAIEIAQASEVVESKGGLDGVIEQGGRNLSGGQKQRLTIARALSANPEILILDDSSSALDYKTDAALRTALRQMAGNTTVFIVSQRASSIMHADKILVLDDGEVVGLGKHEELLDNCEVYREIYSSQFSEEVGV